MGVGGEIVRDEITTDGDVLRDGFAVVAGHAGGEVLRSLDASGGGLDGQAGDGDGRARTAGVGVQQLLAHHHFLGRVGRRYVDLADVGSDDDLLIGGGDLVEPQS